MLVPAFGLRRRADDGGGPYNDEPGGVQHQEDARQTPKYRREYGPGEYGLLVEVFDGQDKVVVGRVQLELGTPWAISVDQ